MELMSLGMLCPKVNILLSAELGMCLSHSGGLAIEVI